jgi:hypothetical protein
VLKIYFWVTCSLTTHNLHEAVKVKVKVHPRPDHEDPDGESMYSFTLSLTSALDGGEVVSATPRPLYPRKRPGSHCVGGWVGPGAGLEGCGISRLHRVSNPGPSSPVYRLSYRDLLTWSCTWTL